MSWAYGPGSTAVTGVVRLPLRLDWSERAEFHLDDSAERNVMYERVIREATQVEDLRSYLNEAVLHQVWRRLVARMHGHIGDVSVHGQFPRCQ
jgi:hypothetical protein